MYRTLKLAGREYPALSFIDPEDGMAVTFIPAEALEAIWAKPIGQTEPASEPTAPVQREEAVA